MRLTFKVERWADVCNEIQPLFRCNWHETGLNHEEIPLDQDLLLYELADQNGQLSITTARAGAELVGYFIFFVHTHPHYKSTLFGFMDVFFLDPHYRKGLNGLNLFLAAENEMQRRGVVEMIANSKLANDVSALFERLEWRRTAICYTKLLERK